MARFSFGATADPAAPAPQAPAAPTPTAQPGGLDALFAALAQAMATQGRLGAGRLALQGDQTFGRHLGAGGGEITGDNPLGYRGGSPFSNGFFQNSAADLTPEARLASGRGTAMEKWASQGQVPGVDSTALNNLKPNLTPLPGGGYSSYTEGADTFSDPFAAARINKIAHPTPFAPPPQPHSKGPFEGMIDPSLPDSQKYKDPNFFTVRPGQANLPPGAVLGDGTTNYYPQGQAPRKGSSFNFTNSPRPGFRF